jgi:hypothetical protein
MIVKLISKNPDYVDLSEGQPYFVIGIEADSYRILNDSGKPYLYPPELFSVMDPSEPEDWVSENGDDGERYAYPASLNTVGFFEDYFENKYEQISVFWQVVNKRLTNAA